MPRFSKSLMIVTFTVVVGLMLPFLLEAQDDDMSIEEQNTEIVRQVVDDIWNGKSIDSLGEYYNSPYKIWNDNTPQTVVTGIMKSFHRNRLDSVFSDTFQMTIDNIFAAENTVAVHFTASGTFIEAWNLPFIVGGSAPPSGEEETWQGVLLFIIDEGKITDELWYWNKGFNDMLSLTLDT